ncbi:hypothetical protein [Streptomyces chromofuscus]|nr:hypothetical protein [Streptomyces chromofuscus]
MIALLVPALLLVLLLAMEAFEDLIFPPPKTPPGEGEDVPEQSTSQ